MDTPRRELISRLFHAALERPPEERRAFVAQACAGDDALQQEIESLLRHDSNVSGFLETPAVAIETNSLSEPAEIVGRQLGPYQIVALLGSGGMGEVYRARDRKLGRDVAIKVLHPRFTADRERRARFAREARILATLSHPHIGAIYGLEESGGLSALVLELVEGPTLADRLANGPLPIVEALTIARQIADALQAAHDKGIVHRDLKPSNVVVQRTVSAAADTLRVRVVDFGLGKLTSMSAMDEAGQTSVMSDTAAGRLMGTPAYMSPEQTRGHAVDKRMDIWAFGAILFEMLTGRRAFEGATIADTFASILEHEPDWSLLPPNTPASIRRLLERCLQKEVRRRFRDMADAVFELDDALGGSAGVVNIGTGSAMVRRGGWTRKQTLGLTAALGLALVAVAAFVWTTRRTTDEPPVVRLTSNPSGMSVTSAHISPDGRHLAFADPTGVQVRSIDGGRVYRFSDTQGMDVYGWTPDSAGVLASRCDNLACVGWAIALVGQDRQRTGAVWSRTERVLAAPDGQRLLRWNYAAAKTLLAVDPMNGSPAREVATGDVFMPTWSADGKRVVYIRSQAQTIESVSAEGGTAIEVFRAPAGQVMRSVIELPDRTILISMMPSQPSIARPSGLIAGTGQSGLWRVYPDRAGVVRNAPRRLTANGANATDLTASSTGRVAFLDIRNQSDVYVADGDVRGGSVNVPRRFTLSDSDNFAYTWTPDSAAVLLSSNRHGTWDIFKQRLESDIAEPFFSGPQHQGYPGITSDGRWVLYADGTSEDDNIMRASLSGGASANVVPHVGRGRLQCAEHGRCVLLEVKDRSFRISSLHPHEGKGRELARIPLTSGFRLLPDGDTFAYILPTENGIRNRVRLLSFIGKPDTDIVVKDAAALVGLGWLPSSAGFLTTDRGKLLLVFPNGTAKVLWAPTGLASIDWAVPSPDEKHLVINVSTRQGNVWMMSRF